jgi:hypothetical protein
MWARTDGCGGTAALRRCCRHGPSRPGAACGLLHAGIDREDIDQAGDTQDPADQGDRADRAAHERCCAVPAPPGRAARLVREPRAPYLLLLGLGFGLSLAPSFSTGTLGLTPSDAGVGSATLNTSQQVGGSIGTALLNTLAAGAATAYLVGRAITPANLQAAALHSYTTAFLYSSLIFVVAAVIAGLVLPRGNMRTLSGLASDVPGRVGTNSRPSARVIPGDTTQRPVGLRTSPAPHFQQ